MDSRSQPPRSAAAETSGERRGGGVRHLAVTCLLSAKMFPTAARVWLLCRFFFRPSPPVSHPFNPLTLNRKENRIQGKGRSHY